MLLSLWQVWQLILNCLKDNSKGQRKQTVEKMYIPLLSPWKDDITTSSRGLISPRCWEAEATLTIAALVFHFFSAVASALSWPPTLSTSTPHTGLSPEAWVMVYWPSTWGDKDLQRSRRSSRLEREDKIKWRQQKLRMSCWECRQRRKHCKKVKSALWHHTA